MALTIISRVASNKLAAIAFVLVTSSYLAGCGGSDVTQNPSYEVGGTVSGLVGSGLVLQDNGSGNLPVSTNGAFHFAAPLSNGSSYVVTVATQPTNPSQNCIVTNGTGTLQGADVTTVTVICSTNGFTVGGNVTGLTGSGLVLQDNGGDDLPLGQTGAFTFSQTVGSGIAYAVTVKTQPTNPVQACTVVNGSGTMGSTNVTDVAVNCATAKYTVSGTITGLVGTGLVLQTNGVTIPTTGTTFSVLLPSGTAYNVMVTTPPSNPSQSCVVVNGSGTLTNASVSGVTVTCSVTQSYTVGGTVTGLLGTGFVLQNNGVAIPIAGGHFSVTLASGSSYNIAVAHQPTTPTQTCTVTNGGPGTITNANVTVSVNCVTTTYSISVSVTGLQVGATGLALFDNGGDSLAITGNTSFTFATKVASGQPYAVTVSTQPTATPAQYCIVLNGSGTVSSSNVTNVSLTCRNVGQALFVANPYDGTNGDVSGFTINPSTGNLTVATTSPFVADVNPSAVALDPVGQYAYVANLTSHDVSTYSVSAATGVLTPLVTAPGYPTSGVASFSIVVDPASANYLYVGSDSGGVTGLIDFYSSTAGVLSTASPITAGNDPLVMAIDPSGLFLFATERYDDTITVYSIGAGGALTNVSNSPFTNGTGSAPVGVAVYPSGGYVYVAGAANGTVSAYAYDATTGALTPLTGSPYTVAAGSSTQLAAVAVDPTGRFLYVTFAADDTISEFSIDPTTGELTAIGTPVATGNGPADVKIEPSGHFLYVANNVDNTVGEYLIDPSTGALTAVTSGGTIFSGVGAQSIAIE